MNTIILLYEGFTGLDAIGPYEVLSQVPGASVRFVAEEAGPITADTGRLSLLATHRLDEIESADILVVPGGRSLAPLLDHQPLLKWLRHIDTTTRWTTSVCVGSLLLGAAGLLKGRRATTHWLAQDQLQQFGAVPTKERVVRDGKVVTAAGVSSGIDMALHLVANEQGSFLAQSIQLGIEYDPQPPFDAGSPDKAPIPVVTLLRSRRDLILGNGRTDSPHA